VPLYALVRPIAFLLDDAALRIVTPQAARAWCHFPASRVVLACDVPRPCRAWHSGGWSDEQLAEAFAYLGLTVFTSYFLNYAGTELDIPAGAPRSGPADTDPPAPAIGEPGSAA
jgi:hypothetical protein